MIDAWAAAMKTIGWVFVPALIWPVLHLMAPHGFIRSLSEAIIRTIDSLTHLLGEIVKWTLPLLVLSVAFSVFALAIFGVTTTKLQESAKYFQAIIIMLGAAATLLAGQHVRVDIFHTNMSSTAKARIELWGFYLFLLPACLLILWNSQTFVGFAWAIREGSSEADGIRGVYLLKTLIPVFAVTMIAQGFAIALRAAMCLSGQMRPNRPQDVPSFFSLNSEDTL